ncbi:MAG: ABC transporter permease, partial [Holophagales bacterium]|nr:ABC transporter permease [Holophagales bacterium]
VALTTLDPYRGPWLQNRVAPVAEQDRDAFVPIHWRAVTRGVFRTFGIPLVRGSSFSEGRAQRRETVISAALAARLWPGEDPIGKQLRWISPEGPTLEVVGVAGDVQDLQLGADPPPTVYLSLLRMGLPFATLAVRTELPRSSLEGAIGSAVRGLDPLLAAPALSSLEANRRGALGQPLLSLRLVAGSAGIALLLAAVGVYGLLAYTASRRRRELGVRVALGARPAQLAGLVVSDGARLVGIGLALGMLAALGVAESLRALLYRTSPFDPGVLATVGGVLLAVGMLATGLPALRAARVDPIPALREE